MEQFMGTVLTWAVPKAPIGWMFCDGTILNISEHASLYSLIGNIYGGDKNLGTFALPNMNGKIPIGIDPTKNKLGDFSDNPMQAIIKNENIPAHTHNISNDIKITGNTDVTIPINMAINIPIYSGAGDLGACVTPSNNTSLGTPVGPTNKIYTTTQPNSSLKPIPVSTISHATLSNPDVAVTSSCDTVGTEEPQNAEVKLPHMYFNYIICVEGIYPNF